MPIKAREICTKVLWLGTGSQLTLTYFVSVDDGTGDLPGPHYGVGIRVKETGNVTFVRSITPEREKAERLADILASNFVTPTALYDCVYDWLCR